MAAIILLAAAEAWGRRGVGVRVKKLALKMEDNKLKQGVTNALYNMVSIKQPRPVMLQCLLFNIYYFSFSFNINCD